MWFGVLSSVASAGQVDPGLERLLRTEERLKDYQALVRRYRANDREPAIHVLGSWNEGRLRQVVEDMLRLKDDLVSGQPPSSRWDVEDVRAAVLLQTERAMVYARNSNAGLATQAHLAHLDTARRLLDGVDRQREGWEEFRLSWWRSVIPWIYRRIDRAGLRRYALDAIALYPNDPEVRLAVGTAFEIALQNGWGDDPEVPSDPVVARREFGQRRVARAGTEDARLALENLTFVLQLVPQHPEALLRRGRAHQLIGDEEKAAADLSSLLRVEASPLTHHLAHLFLGSGHQAAEPARIEEARREYEAALRLTPKAQSARLALASVLLINDRVAAENLIREMLASQGEVSTGTILDPWSIYGLGQAATALTTFSRLRNDLWRGWPR